jgi:hypothetical protein
MYDHELKTRAEIYALIAGIQASSALCLTEVSILIKANSHLFQIIRREFDLRINDPAAREATDLQEGAKSLKVIAENILKQSPRCSAVEYVHTQLWRLISLCEQRIAWLKKIF